MLFSDQIEEIFIESLNAEKQIMKISTKNRD